MWEILAEVAAWVLGCVSAVAGAGIIYLLRRLEVLRDELRDHRIQVAEQYVHRGDWVREHTALEARMDIIHAKLSEIQIVLGELGERTRNV